MTTTASTGPYVVCEKFCGLAIRDPEKDHDEKCGAPPEERERLKTALSAARIRAASVADGEPQFVCSCDTAFETWEQLGVHQTSTGHVGCKTDDVNDETPAGGDRVVAATVDGHDSRVHHHAPNNGAAAGDGEKKQDFTHLWRDPPVDLDWIFDLQNKIDDGNITVGGIAAGKACIGKMSAKAEDGSTVEVSCPHRTFVRSVRSNTCDLEHTHTETLEQICLLHAITSWGGGIAPAGNGPLFGGAA